MLNAPTAAPGCVLSGKLKIAAVSLPMNLHNYRHITAVLTTFFQAKPLNSLQADLVGASKLK